MNHELLYQDNTKEVHDRFHVWRSSGDIGYVYLAFAVVIESIKDLFYGNSWEYYDACNFWHIKEQLDEETLDSHWSSCKLWLAVLGMEDIPTIVSDEIYGRRNFNEDINFQDDVEEYLGRLEHLFGLMKIDYYGILGEETI